MIKTLALRLNSLSSCSTMAWAVFAFEILMAFVTQVAEGQEHIEFNRNVRPILAENCLFCHGQDSNKRQADLRLDVRQSAIDIGAIVPGNLQDSTLIERIASEDPNYMMPPLESNRRLSNDQKSVLN